MGSIVTIATSKGGGGKTTLATCLAVGLTTRGYKVAVIDADRNATFNDWHRSNYEGPEFLSLAEARHVEVIDLAQQHAETHDVVVIDTAGFENLTSSSAISTADYVLIPCMPDRGSIREAMKTAHQTQTLSRAARRAIPYRVVLSQWNNRGLAEKATRDDLGAAEVSVLESFIPDLAAYRQLTFTGRVPVDGKVGEQINALVDELVTLQAIPDTPSGPAIASSSAAPAAGGADPVGG